MSAFNPADVLDNLSGLELLKCAEWLRENNWWEQAPAQKLSEADEQVLIDLSVLGENLQLLNSADKEIIAVLAKRFKTELP